MRLSGLRRIVPLREFSVVLELGCENTAARTAARTSTSACMPQAISSPPDRMIARHYHHSLRGSTPINLPRLPLAYMQRHLGSGGESSALSIVLYHTMSLFPTAQLDRGKTENCRAGSVPKRCLTPGVDSTHIPSRKTIPTWTPSARSDLLFRAVFTVKVA